MKTFTEVAIESQTKDLPELCLGDPSLEKLYDDWQENSNCIPFGTFVRLRAEERESAALLFAFTQGCEAAYSYRENVTARPPVKLTRWWVLLLVGSALLTLIIRVMLVHDSFWVWFFAIFLTGPSVILTIGSGYMLMAAIGERDQHMKTVPPTYTGAERDKHLNGEATKTIRKFYDERRGLGPDGHSSDL